jgi:hypothetical protein
MGKPKKPKANQQQHIPRGEHHYRYPVTLGSLNFGSSWIFLGVFSTAGVVWLEKTGSVPIFLTFGLVFTFDWARYYTKVRHISAADAWYVCRATLEESVAPPYLS